MEAVEARLQESQKIIEEAVQVNSCASEYFLNFTVKFSL
jgi:hypothetical protein